MTNFKYHVLMKILGDLENSCQLNIIILKTKKVIYFSKLEGILPSLIRVQASTKQVFLHEHSKMTINNKIQDGIYCLIYCSTIQLHNIQNC